MGLCKRCGTIINQDEVYCEFCKVELKDKIREKTCRWCKNPFTTHIPNELYCSTEHRQEAIKESKRKHRNKIYKNNKKTSILSQIGTTTLSTHPNPDSEREIEIIQKEMKRTFSTTSSKKGIKNNQWIDHQGEMEYGEIPPCGVLNTHNYASFDDYYQTAKHHLLTSKGKCPECGCPDHYKTDMDVSCAFCGLVLEGNPNLMGATVNDVVDSENSKKRKEIVCPDCNHKQDVIINSENVLKDKYVKCKQCDFIIENEIKSEINTVKSSYSSVNDIAWKKYWAGE